MTRARRPLLALAAVAAAVSIAGCGGDERGTEQLCDRLREEVAGLEGPLTTPAEVDAMVERYRRIERVAPLAVQPAWERLVALIETADTVVPEDPASVQRVADAAYAAAQSAREAASWAKEQCGLTLPAVGQVGSAPPTTAG